MTRDEMVAALTALLQAFPTLREFYVSNDLRDIWLRQLADCDASDVMAAVEDMIAGKHSLPPNYAYDRVAIELRSLARKRRAERQEAQRMDDLLATPSADQWKYNLGSLMKASRAAGEKLKAGEITQAENDRIASDLRSKARERA